MNMIQEFKPDIITGSWAGGFNDPVGFLAMLRPLLGEDFKNYLGTSLGEKLTSAEIHSDLNLRTIAFQDIGIELLHNALLIPGWRIDVFESRLKSITNNKNHTRYTPRLINYGIIDISK